MQSSASSSGTAAEAGGPRFSIVVAVFNEADNVAPVTAEIMQAAFPLGPFELIYVDDASNDETPERLRVLRARHGAIRVLRHDRRCGKSAALVTGIGAARAPWIVTMDGDGQDDAAEIPRLLEAAWAAGEPSPLVAGIRTTGATRRSRRLATKFANGLRQSCCATIVPTRPAASRRSAVTCFCACLPSRACTGFCRRCSRPRASAGLRPVNHRPRLRGQSKYTNFGRAVVGVADMLGVIWLRRRTRLPGRVVEE